MSSLLSIYFDGRIMKECDGRIMKEGRLFDSHCIPVHRGGRIVRTAGGRGVTTHSFASVCVCVCVCMCMCV